MKAFTYLIKNNITGKWYYGVRYSINCKTTDILTTYFTSSTDVKSDIKLYGVDAFSYEIRKEFNSAQHALRWECKVLRRMKIRTNPMCYNKHSNKGFTTRYGSENSSTRADVREKLSIKAKNREPQSQDIIEKRRYKMISKNIVSAFRNNNFPIKRSMHVKYNKWALFLITNKPKCQRMINYIQNIIEMISEIKNKPYPTNRKTPVFLTKSNKRSISKIGYKWYTSPDRRTAKPFFDISTVPAGWVPGLRTIENVEKHRVSSSGRKHSDETKEKLRDKAKKKIYYTSPDLIQLVAVYSVCDAPIGWIKGNKLQSRNDKLKNRGNNEN